ncbi:MAG: DUF1801 domain-containing protein [Planctomycetota bacterium]|jgi:hypothetical protein
MATKTKRTSKPAKKAATKKTKGRAKAGAVAKSPKPGKVATVKDYLAALPDDRRKALSAVRKVIRKNLDPKFEEGIQYGMIGWYVPHKVYPDGYHCDPKQPLPFASIASQKNHMAVYMMCIYGSKAEEQRFRKAWAKTGKKLDMGKSCVRFKKLEDLPLDVIGDAIGRVSAKDYIAQYERNLKGAGKRKR